MARADGDAGKGRKRAKQDSSAMADADAVFPFDGHAELAALVRQRALRLVATTIAARQPVTVAALRSEVVAGLGGHPLDQCLLDLVASGHATRTPGPRPPDLEGPQPMLSSDVLTWRSAE